MTPKLLEDEKPSTSMTKSSPKIKTKRRNKKKTRTKTAQNSTGNSDSSSEDERPYKCKKTSKIYTTQAVETHEYEITIGRHQGSLNYIFNGPIILSPNVSMDVILESISRECNLPLERLRTAVESCSEMPKSLEKSVLQDPTSSPFSNLGPKPEIQAEIGTQNASKSRTRVQIEGEDCENEAEQILPTVISSGLDDEGNMKISLRLARTISTKAVRVKRESSHIMAKACYLTLFCFVLILFIWIVLNHMGTAWNTRIKSSD